MKTLLKNKRSLFEKMEERPAASALAELGVMDPLELAVRRTPVHTFAESMEDKLVEVAFAEAADYEDIHKEKRVIQRLLQTDKCQYGDHDLCHTQA